MVRATYSSLPGIGLADDDDGVARLDLDEPVVAVGHPGEAGHRLALGAGRRDDQLAVGRCP